MSKTPDEQADAIRERVNVEMPRPIGGFETDEQEQAWKDASEKRFDELCRMTHPSNTEAGHRCCKEVADQGGFHFHRCKIKARVNRDGKWYCLKHDPIVRAAKSNERMRRWDEEQEQRKRDHACIAALAGLRPEALAATISAFQKVLDCSTRWSRTEKVPIEVMDAARIALANLKIEKEAAL